MLLAYILSGVFIYFVLGLGVVSCRLVDAKAWLNSLEAKHAPKQLVDQKAAEIRRCLKGLIVVIPMNAGLFYLIVRIAQANS